jgi:hypothetical protein
MTGCNWIGELRPGAMSQKTPALIHSGSLTHPARFDAALKENQTALRDGKSAPDVALYNIGIIFSDSSNPKRDYGKALVSFRRLTHVYPRSSLAEQAKTWVHVLEQHQHMTEEKQKLAEEKRSLMREQEILSQEREKIKYVTEKSRQIDDDIEKKRRQIRTK